MKKSEYLEIKKEIILSGEEKLIQAKNQYLSQKEEFKNHKKGYRIAKKELKEETNDKLLSLHKEYKNIPFEKEERVKEKDMSEEQIRILRESRKLPFYSHSEEVFNFVTHVIGGGFSVVFLIISIICATIYQPGNLTVMLSMSFFSLTAIALYSISSIYHGLHINKGKNVLQVLDHCTIYLLIAGTYTPGVLLGLSSISPYHYIFLGVIYLLSILGIVLNATMMKKTAVEIISMILYIMIGWGIIIFFPQLIENLTLNGTLLLTFGGISYTIGSILYGIGSKKKYFHSVFHIFVLFGTILQFLALLLYGVIFA